MPISTNKAIREIIGVAIPLLVWLTPIAGLPPQGQRGFALVVFAILYWTLEPIPQAWTSVLVLIFVPLLGVADSTTALSGFATGAFGLVFASLLLGEGVLQSGLGKRLALLSLKVLGTRYESNPRAGIQDLQPRPGNQGHAPPRLVYRIPYPPRHGPLLVPPRLAVMKAPSTPSTLGPGYYPGPRETDDLRRRRSPLSPSPPLDPARCASYPRRKG